MMLNRFEEIEFSSQAIFYSVSLQHPKSSSEILDYCCFHGLLQHFLGTSNFVMTSREARIKQKYFEPFKKKANISRIDYIEFDGVYEGEKDVWVVFVCDPSKHLDSFEALIDSLLYFSDKTTKAISIVLLETIKKMDVFTFTQYGFQDSFEDDKILFQRSLRYKLKLPIEKPVQRNPGSI